MRLRILIDGPRPAVNASISACTRRRDATSVRLRRGLRLWQHTETRSMMRRRGGMGEGEGEGEGARWEGKG